jgi:hypothetical protein
MESGYVKRIVLLIVYGFFVGGFILFLPIVVMMPRPVPRDLEEELMALTMFVLAPIAGSLWGLICGIMLERFRQWHLRMQDRAIRHRLSIVLLIQTGLLVPLWFTVLTTRWQYRSLAEFLLGFVAFFVAISGVTSGIAYLVACRWRSWYPFEKRKYEALGKAKGS